MQGARLFPEPVETMLTELFMPAAILLLLVASLVGSLWVVLRFVFTAAALARPLTLLIAGGGAWAGLTHGGAILRFLGM